jgi:hypothetical protein
MSIILSWKLAAITSAAALAVGIAAGAGGMHVWKAGQIAGLKVNIAELKQAKAEDVSVKSQQALTDLADASKKIKEAAQTGQADVSAITAKLDVIRRNQNVKPPAPLPVDCKPGPERVRNLTDSAAAVNSAIARPVPVK